MLAPLHLWAHKAIQLNEGSHAAFAVQFNLVRRYKVVDLVVSPERDSDMAFPEISKFPQSYPGPYELQMGNLIANLLILFAGRVPDAESNAHVTELAVTTARWSAGHAVFDEVRKRLLAAMEEKDRIRQSQYHFEESCCQAIYNATNADDLFDPSSAFFIAPQAISLARAVGVLPETVVAILAPPNDAIY